MGDLYVRIEVDPDSGGNLGKAVAALHEADPDFLWPTRPWWHKPPDNARSRVARVLSRFGLRGRLSLEEHAEGTPWDEPPPPRWTGFSPKRSR